MIGTVSASSAVAIGVTVVATVVVLALLFGVVSLLRTARRLRAVADELAGHTAVALDDVEHAMARARGELDRVDDLIGSAEAITHTVGATSRLARLAFAGPLIKVVALGAGTARAGRRLKGRTG
ncbi:MAG TPA: hypothetical protein VGL49_04185 [Acidimicrobiales bacterium]